MTSKDYDNSYAAYQTFCQMYGFRCMNIINFEVKSKFVRAYIDGKKNDEKLKPVNVDDEDIPF